MIGENGATTVKSNRKRSSRRRRPTTPQSATSSQTEDNSLYFRNSHGQYSVTHRRMSSNVSNGRSQSYDEHPRRANSHSSTFSHGNSHKAKKKIYNRLLPFFNSTSRRQQLPHSHAHSHLNGIQISKRSATKLDSRFILLSLCLTFFIYVLVVVKFVPNFSLPLYNDLINPKTRSFIPASISSEKYFPANSNKRRASTMTKKMQKLQQEAITNAKTRATNRQTKTRPPKLIQSEFSGEYYNKPFHSFHFDTSKTTPFTKSEQSLPNDLCGTIAKATVSSYMDQANEQKQTNNPFPKQYALDKKAVVLITGILNPLGFHLAMALHDQCGVNRIIGMDPMLPNTLLYRLDLMRKLSILTKNIKDLYQPVYVSYIGISPKRKSSKDPAETDVVTKFHPTHIVHLGALDGTYVHKVSGLNGGGSSAIYGSGRPLLQFREAHISMDQILSSIKNSDIRKRPHVTFASLHNEGENAFGGASKLGEELIANTYRKLHGIHSVAVRLGNIYGPWCFKKGSMFYKSMDNLVRAEKEPLLLSSEEELEWTYVQNAVDMIIAGMQYRPPDDVPAVLNTSRYRGTWNGLMAQAETIFEGAAVPDTKESFFESNELIKSPVPISVNYGLTKTLAWHLDSIIPFGPTTHPNDDDVQPNEPLLETGNDFLLRIGQPDCALNDFNCTYGIPTLPCASECVAANSRCIPSVFDKILTASKRVTQSCDIVLYTSFLGGSGEIVLESERQSQQMLPNEKICYIAYVSKHNSRVKELLSTKKDGKESADLEEMYVKHNGNIVEKGWNLVWVEDEKDAISHADTFLAKLSPGKLFSPTVQYAMFVDPVFQNTPKSDDILFMVSSMRRKAAPERRAYLKNGKGEKLKVTLPAEEEKRAIFMAAPLKSNSNLKMSVSQATESYKQSLGMKDIPESKSLSLQREFYSRVTSYLDREDIRPLLEPKERIEMKYWMQTVWMIHDLKEDEGRHLRCEWYEEHTLWGGEIDALSFGYILAKKELERKVGRNEMDGVDNEPLEPPEPWEEAILDTKDWIPLLHSRDGVRPNIVTIEDDILEEDEIPNLAQLAQDEDNVYLYIRIISNQIMLTERKEWLENRQRLLKQ